MTMAHLIKTITVALILGSAFTLAAQTPFAATTYCNNLDRELGPLAYCTNHLSIPSNNRWVIRNISIGCETPSNVSITEVVLTMYTGGVASFILPDIPAPKPLNDGTGEAITNLSMMTHVYADAGSNILFEVHPSGVVPIQRIGCVLELQGDAIKTP